MQPAILNICFTIDIISLYYGTSGFVEVLLSHFSSWKALTRALKDYLEWEDISDILVKKGPKHNVKAKVGRRREVLFSDLLKLYKSEAQSPQTIMYNGDQRSLQVGCSKSSYEHKENVTEDDWENAYFPVRCTADPRVSGPLPTSPSACRESLTLETDRKSVDNVHYFVCDLEDRINMAILLDEYSWEEMNMQERYIWCVSPLQLDNKLCVSFFRTWAWEYVKCNKVRLNLASGSLNINEFEDLEGNEFASNVNVPDTPRKLLKLEVFHQALELYIWLGYRFGEELFVDMNVAISLCRRCSALISQSLELIGIDKKSSLNSNGARSKRSSKRNSNKKR